MGLIRHNMVVRFWSVIAVCICTAFFLSGCKKEQAVAPPQPPVVSVVEVIPKDVPVSIEYVAQTQSSHLVNIQARVSGFLDKRVYTEGEIVKQGQVLFLMDPKPFQAQLTQAIAALSMQKASLETARSNLARTKPLAEQKALSQKDLDDAKGQFESAAASVEQSSAQVETARLNLSYTTISSPVTGVTSAAQQTDGTYISTNNSLLTTVAVLSPMWVNFSISENEMQKFRNQADKGLMQRPKDDSYIVEIILVDGSIYPHTGRITFADPSYNSQTGTFLIRASVDNPKGVLRPNQYVRVRLKGAIRPRAILVPQAAIQQGPKGHFVWVAGKDGKVDQRPVVVGDWHENDWFIFEGLSSGDQVVVEGTLSLRPDMLVTAKPYSASREMPAAVDNKPKADAVKAGK
ncbi:MAG: efflux RND transporter periplasmic adaptor subunit [Deltaproteobacteria bacterium]|nr:efflux RND transporter periplasmic adaptor subunit [Deltaproteobacteria bacterium]